MIPSDPTHGSGYTFLVLLTRVRSPFPTTVTRGSLKGALLSVHELQHPLAVLELAIPLAAASSLHIIHPDSQEKGFEVQGAMHTAQYAQSVQDSSPPRTANEEQHTSVQTTLRGKWSDHAD